MIVISGPKVNAVSYVVAKYTGDKNYLGNDTIHFSYLIEGDAEPQITMDFGEGKQITSKFKTFSDDGFELENGLIATSECDEDDDEDEPPTVPDDDDGDSDGDSDGDLE